MKKLSLPIDLIKKAVTIFTKKEDLLFLVKIYIPIAVFSVISIVQSLLPGSIVNSKSVWLFLGVVLIQILHLLTAVFVTVSGILALGKVVEGERLSLGDTYKKAWKKYWRLFLLSVVLSLIYLLGFTLLIVPGVLFVVWFAFSRFIAVEKSLGIRESLSKSRQLVKGIYWKILGRLIVFGLFTVGVQIILSVIPFGLGSLVSSLCGGLYMLPIYLLYRELSV